LSPRPDLERQVGVLRQVALEDLALVRMAVSAPEVSGRIFGFHAQQCVEKLLKAVLASCGVDFPFTHDLEALRRLLVEQGLTVPVDPTALALLTPFSVRQRYGELDDEPVDRAEILELAEQVTAWAAEWLEGAQY
jgi:HEPN domain-containing protein